MTIFLIAFTPLREYIPGYSSTKLKRQAKEISEKLDSLEAIVKYTDDYIGSFSNVLKGNFETFGNNADSVITPFKIDHSNIDLRPIKEDTLLRQEVSLEDKYNFFESDDSNITEALYAPVTGVISEKYDADNKHFAVDIAVSKNTPVKAVADGTVIFAEWTAETGYVIILEHQDGLLSVYKHNGSLSKLQGDLVKAGEVIALVGNTGHLTTGTHLHFELWSNRFPINPSYYIDFE